MPQQLYFRVIEKAAEWAPERVRRFRRREKYSPAGETKHGSSAVQPVA